MGPDDVCCLIIFVILVVIWIARQISRAKKEKGAGEGVRPGYRAYEKKASGKQEPAAKIGYMDKAYEKIGYKKKGTTFRPDYGYKTPYQPAQTTYKPAYVQPKSEKILCKRCNSDDLKFFDSGYVKCNKCGYYYYEGSRRIEHRRS